MTIYLGTTPLTSTSGQRNIGQIIQSTIPLTDAGLHLLDGSVISGNGAYSAFATHIAGLVSGHSELFTTEANWQTSNDNYGACDKFVYDSVNNTVRLPKRVTDHGVLIKSYSAGTDWYRIYSDGWCEQGGYNSTATGSDTYYSLAFLKPFANTDYFFINQVQCNRAIGSGWDSGCLDEVYTSRTTTGTEVTTDGISTSKTHYGFRWYACGYTDISDLQQTPVYEYIVIANSVKTPVEVDIDEVMTDLNDKVDKSDLAPVQCVIETYSSGADWYRVWSDGWIEQGGAVQNIDTNILITLLKPFAGTDYSVVASPASNNNKNTSYSAGIGTRTATQVNISFAASYTGNSQCYWYACGY